MKKIFFIFIDALRWDVFDDNMTDILIPELSNIKKKGIIQKLITNGQVTKFASPSIFTQTFPLDYGGYNFGIKDRPKSFVELMKQNGFLCRMFEGHDLDGPSLCYERGFDKKSFYYDKRLLVEGFIKKKILYDVSRWKKGFINKEEILSIIQKELSDIFIYMISQERVSHGLFQKKIGILSNKEKKLIYKEIDLLKNNPEEILQKITKINPYFYFDYVGKKFSKLLFLKFRVRNKLHYYKKLIQILFNKLFSTDLNFVTSRPKITANCKKMLIDSLDGYEQLKGKVFTYIHFMHLHDHHVFSSLSDFTKLRFLPKVLFARFQRKKENLRRLTYDLTLAEIDHYFSIFLKKLKKLKKFKNSTFVIIGDHGEGWDLKREKSLRTNFGFRTYYEHLQCPLIISPCKENKKNLKLYDSMSISASVLDILKIKSHSSFKGRSVFTEGKNVIITENCGRGNADIYNKDIYFTMTSLKYKLFCKIEGNLLILKRFYDTYQDKRELQNIIDRTSTKILNNFLSYLYKNRKEILNKRGFREIPKLGHYNVKVLADHIIN